MRGVYWYRESTRRSPRSIGSSDELEFWAAMGMVGMGCTDLLSRNFENENEGGGGEA
jgi:hypothetical protein